MAYDVCDVWYVWNEKISIYLHTLQQKTFICSERAKVPYSLFPSRKWSLPFLTVAATTGNQAMIDVLYFQDEVILRQTIRFFNSL